MIIIDRTYSVFTVFMLLELHSSSDRHWHDHYSQFVSYLAQVAARVLL